MILRSVGYAEYERLGKLAIVPDMTKHIHIPDQYKNDPKYYILYEIKDTDRLDSISENLYGSPLYWWILPLMNNMINIHQSWPVPMAHFNEWFSENFESSTRMDIHHFEDQNGVIQDPASFVELDGLESVEEAINIYNLQPVYLYDYEVAKNEAKRKVKLLLPEFTNTLSRQIESLLR